MDGMDLMDKELFDFPAFFPAVSRHVPACFPAFSRVFLGIFPPFSRHERVDFPAVACFWGCCQHFGGTLGWWAEFWEGMVILRRRGMGMRRDGRDQKDPKDERVASGAGLC